MRAYRIAYDGRQYRGFQRQPDVPTVEDELLDALRELGVVDAADVPADYAAAGRTDAGASARAQTVAFDAPDWLTPAALNGELPADVRAWASAPAPEDFHATHDAASRAYTYFLYAPEASRGRAERALSALAGEHDFHNLTPDERGTVRELTAAVRREGAFLIVTLRAGGFARQLVRRIVTVIAAVARGEAGLDRIERLLGEEPVDGAAGVASAPAHPLVLDDVAYPGLDFAVDADAAESAREVFDARRVERATGARVANHLGGVGSDRSE